MKRVLLFHLLFWMEMSLALAPAQDREGAWFEQLDLHGFADLRTGFRTQDDPHQDDESLGEFRGQIDFMRYVGPATVQIRVDGVGDWVADDTDVDLETGRGWVDVREANVLFSPHPSVDVKLGRQILTWGTGDLLFINDLFPKDWQSFFVGRDTEYLKAPSDAVFMSFFPSFANIDLAYMPRFDPDRGITGERLSFWNGALGQRTGQDHVVIVDTPDDWGSDDEWNLRISKTLRGYELAFYACDGFWKSPGGMNPDTGEATYPGLSVYGASLRGQMGKGILSVEAGYYDSRDDAAGDNPWVRNSEMRYLVGYDQELARNLTGAGQLYVEAMQDHEGYRAGMPESAPVADGTRTVLTMRLTRQAMDQTLVLSLFAYYSPTDEDAYLRPNISYKATDAWLLTMGGNAFFGSDDHTFFAQFEDNNNVFAGARYSF